MTRRLGEGAQHGHYSPRPKETSHYTSSLGSLETVSDEPKGAFEPKRVEHEMGGVLGPGGGNFGRARTGKIVSARAGLLWPKTFSPEKVFEQCQADPCMFRRVLRGKVVVIIVVYVGDLLMASGTKRGEERLVASLTATPRSGVRSGDGNVFTPHRLQCGMPNLE